MPGKTSDSMSGSAIVLPSEMAARTSLSASSMTTFPAVRDTISRASRMGTPLAIMVPRVRLKRATATFRSSGPKTGAFR